MSGEDQRIGGDTGTAAGDEWPRRVHASFGEGVAQFGQATPAKQQLQKHQRRESGIVVRIPALGTKIGGVGQPALLEDQPQP